MAARVLQAQHLKLACPLDADPSLPKYLPSPHPHTHGNRRDSSASANSASGSNAQDSSAGQTRDTQGSGGGQAEPKRAAGRGLHQATQKPIPLQVRRELWISYQQRQGTSKS